jgi:hypothetical protein
MKGDIHQGLLESSGIYNIVNPPFSLSSKLEYVQLDNKNNITFQNANRE